MTENDSTKRWYLGYVCGDTGLVSPSDEWVIENTRSITDLEKNWDTVVDLLNEQYTRIKTLENEIQDFQKLLSENDNVCYNKVQETLQNHYNELTRQLEGRIDCPCSAQSRGRIIAIMEELGVELK